MNNKKAIILLIAASVLITAVAGIAFAQYAGAQTNGLTQIPQGTTGVSSANPIQGYYPYGSTQNGYSMGYGRGMGMCGRFW
jgi:hypothetical protein